ncbi:hypothetical protein ACNKHV_15590 [Shigella flexneri]
MFSLFLTESHKTRLYRTGLGLRDNMDELKKAGVDVLGIGADKPEKLSVLQKRAV